ncbi:MAG: nucleotide sugar dehydrogenase [Chitinophagales bacterium]
MNISVFGLGHLGSVNLGCLARNGHNVTGVDVSETKIDQVNSGISPINEKDIDNLIREERNKGRVSATKDYSKAILDTEISVIAVGTFSGNTGHPDMENIFRLAQTFGRILRGKNDFHVMAIRSDVVPGTSMKFSEIIEEYSGKKRNLDFAVVSNPHFLRKGTAVNDYYYPPVTLIGSDHREAAEKVASLYRNFPAEVIITDARVAELMKYVNNTFHALKVSFANEIGNICAAMQIDSHKVMEIFCADKELNISPYYLKPGFAFGGPGLSKELKGLQAMAQDHHVKTPLIEAIEKANESQISRAVGMVQQTKKKKVGILGLSFKPGTNSLRNSPSVALIETLLGKGYEIAIYDKNIQPGGKGYSHKAYIEKHLPHFTKLMRSQVSDLMNDSELIIVNNKEKEYTDVLINVEIEHPIIDMVRLPDTIRQKKNYQGINW